MIMDREDNQTEKECPMKWYYYIACFFAGAFLANTVPHFVHGISGDWFPSPFANPPGRGLSSPLVNVLWGLGNLVAGYVLFRAGKVFKANVGGLLVFLAGIAFISITCAHTFALKAH
jgi:hypothetical protein